MRGRPAIRLVQCLLAALVIAAVAAAGCAADDADDDDDGHAGTSSTSATGGAGGASSTGGATATGGNGAGGPASGPELLYDGPVGGQLTDWDHTSPWPLVALGQQANDWVLTLLRIEANGTLTDNLAERVVVWGWKPGAPGAPPLRYDGPVGGVLPGWNQDTPAPLVAVGGPAVPSSWSMTLLRVLPDGTLTDNVAERVILWGWDTLDAGVPSVRYDGAVGGTIPGWSPSTPEPLIAGGESTALQSWWMTLCRVLPDGTTADNVSDRLVLWGW